MIAQRNVVLDDGRILSTYDSASGTPQAFTVIWHHGSPQTGALLDPLVAATASRGIRLISYGRPSYGGSTPRPGRDVASAAADVVQVADALGVGRFASMGASGGGPHALACAALLQDRVASVCCLAGIAPLTEEFDWFDGMVAPGGLEAAIEGRTARAHFAAIDEFDPGSFIRVDHDALDDPWSSLGRDAMRAGDDGPDGLIDDDVAFVFPWGFDFSQIRVPVLFVQGGMDRIVPAAHGRWQTHAAPHGELWLRPRDGHISVLNASFLALDWLLANAN